MVGNDLTVLIKKLQIQVTGAQTKIAVLQEQRAALAARNEALAALDTALTALLECSTAVLGGTCDDGTSSSGEEGSAGGTGGGTSSAGEGGGGTSSVGVEGSGDGTNSGGSEAEALAAWRAQLRSSQAHAGARLLPAGESAGRAGTGGTSGGAALGWAALLGSWLVAEGPGALRERFDGFTGLDVCGKMRQFCEYGSVLLMRVRGAAFDAAAARERLRAMLDDVIATYCCVLVLRPVALHEANTLRGDTGDAVGPCDPDTMTPERWSYVLREMQLDDHQRLAARALLDLYHHRVSHVLLPRHAELMRRQEARAGVPEEQWQLLLEISGCQASFAWAVTGTVVALWSILLTPEQAAAMLVAAYPMAPTLLGLREALEADTDGRK